MGANAELVRLMGPQLDVLLPMLDEKSRRLVLGAVARAAGDGGITAVADAAGASWQTVANGAAELESGDAVPPGRVRRPGGGRKRLEEHDPRLTAALRELVEASTRGDPQSLRVWTTLSVRDIAAELTRRGHPCGKGAVLRLLHAGGFSTQGNSRTVEGRRHPDRDGQFRHIARRAREFLAAGDPVISIDTKKKELVGLYARNGREWPAAPARAGRCGQDTLNHPALTGTDPADLNALAAALEIPYRARREQHLYTRRRRGRVRAEGAAPPRKIDLTDHLLATRMRRHLNLPAHVIAALLGVDRTTISHAVSLTGKLLDGVPQPPAAAPPGIRLRTLDDLRGYAAGHGITITGPADEADTPPDDTLTTPGTPQTHLN